MLSEIGQAHGKSVAQVALRPLVQRDVVVIPKTVRPDRMAENIGTGTKQALSEGFSQLS